MNKIPEQLAYVSTQRNFMWSTNGGNLIFRFTLCLQGLYSGVKKLCYLSITGLKNLARFIHWQKIEVQVAHDVSCQLVFKTENSNDVAIERWMTGDEEVSTIMHISITLAIRLQFDMMRGAFFHYAKR